MTDQAPFNKAPALEVKELTIQISLPGPGPVNAINDVSFTVKPGETLALVGESGCGKSLTATSLMRLLPSNIHIAGGSIKLNGEELTRLSEKQMRRKRGAGISMIFQDPMTALNPLVTIGDQIEETLQIHTSKPRSERRRQVLCLLERVGVSDAQRRMDQFPHELSGGMRQRVMIAAAMIGEPSVIVADEPTTALDVTVQAQILALLKELQTEHGMGIVLITHDIGVVAQTADRVAIMYAGRIVEQGPVADIFEAPSHPYTRALLECSRPVARNAVRACEGQRLAQIDGTVTPILKRRAGCAFAPRCRHVTDECLHHLPPCHGHDHQVLCCHPRDMVRETVS